MILVQSLLMATAVVNDLQPWFVESPEEGVTRQTHPNHEPIKHFSDSTFIFVSF